jgi:hypothetical protein
MASAAHDSTGDAEGNNPTIAGLADHFSRAAEEDMASAGHDSTGDAEGNVARDEETEGKF